MGFLSLLEPVRRVLARHYSVTVPGLVDTRRIVSLH
jgi:hypothetical protein